MSSSCIAFNVAIGFFNFKNSSQREPSKKRLGHISIVMHAARAHKEKKKKKKQYFNTTAAPQKNHYTTRNRTNTRPFRNTVEAAPKGPICRLE